MEDQGKTYLLKVLQIMRMVMVVFYFMFVTDKSKKFKLWVL